MSENWHYNIRHVTPGEPVQAGIVGRPDRALQDRTDYLKQRLDAAELGRALNVQFVPVRGGMHGQSILLDGEEVHMELRTETAGNAASQVAALPAVREALLQRQRDFLTDAGLVADGRDMGTVVFPDAPLKVFLVASAEVRAERRYMQLKDSVPDVTLASLLEEIRARDERDMQRAVAPLKPAADAILLDSTELSIEQVLETILTEAAMRGLAG